MMLKNCEEILGFIKSHVDKSALQGMARFGINTDAAYGVSIPVLRKIAKETGKNHDLALELWSSGVHEARILASIIDVPECVTEEQMESWVMEFDSWDVCDQCCSNLFSRTRFAFLKASSWSMRDEEFVKRAGFVLMATLAVHDKKVEDDAFIDLLPMIKSGSADERNFVRKAVNWALRQIGKRNMHLNKMAIDAAREIKAIDSKSARWIATGALRELEGESVQIRLNRTRLRKAA